MIFFKKSKLRALANDMREGAKKRPQAFTHSFAYVTVPTDSGMGEKAVLGSCALGAAYEDGGQEYIGIFMQISETLYKRHPILRKKFMAPFELIQQPSWYGYNQPRPLMSLIIGLNDDLRWSREKIADWIETL